MSLLPVHSYTNNTLVAKTFLAIRITQARPKKRYSQPYVETAVDGRRRRRGRNVGWRVVERLFKKNLGHTYNLHSK